MSIESLIALMIASFIVKVTPGPGVFATTGISLTRGVHAGLLFVCGTLLGDLVFVVAVLLGLTVVAREFHEVFFAIRVIGGCYLIYLGYLALTSKAPAIERFTPKAVGHFKIFLNGFLVTLANPKAILFYVGLLPTFIDLAALNQFDMILLSVLMITDTGLILAAYAIAANQARQFFQSPRAGKNLNRTAGVVLAGSGIGVITTS